MSIDLIDRHIPVHLVHHLCETLHPRALQTNLLHSSDDASLERGRMHRDSLVFWGLPHWGSDLHAFQEAVGAQSPGRLHQPGPILLRSSNPQHLD